MRLAAIHIPKGELSYVFGDNHEGYTLNLGGKYLYECNHHDGDDEFKVTRTLNENYIDRFFGNEITKISALVGANGTGKSSVLSLFRGHSFCSCIYENIENDEYIIKEMTDNINDIIYYSPYLNIQDQDYVNSHFKDVSIYETMLGDVAHENLELSALLELYNSENLKRWIKFRKIPNIENNLNEINLPVFNQIVVKLNHLTVTHYQTSDNFRPFFDVFKKIKEKERTLLFKELEGDTSDENLKESSKNYGNKIELKLEIIDRVINKVHNILEMSSNKYLREGYLIGNIEVDNDEFEKITSLEEAFYWFLDNAYIDLSEKIFLPKKEIKELIKVLLSKVPNSDDDIDNWTKLKVSFDDALEIIEVYERFIISFKKDFTYDKKILLTFRPNKNLSSGEKSIYNLFSILYDYQYKVDNRIDDEYNMYSKKDKYNNAYLLLLDEADLGFHPQWKKKYIKTLTDILPLLFPEKKIQILFTTHDPLTLSDIPSSNVTYLSKKISGETEVVSSSDHRDIKTFGANIHSLLADSFFLEDGFMGDFAKEKINDLIKYLTFNDSIEESEVNEKAKRNWTPESAEKFIAIIGEPLLEYDLKELYLSKFYDVRKIDEEIQKLQELKNRLGK